MLVSGIEEGTPDAPVTKTVFSFIFQKPIGSRADLREVCAGSPMTPAIQIDVLNYIARNPSSVLPEVHIHVF